MRAWIRFVAVLLAVLLIPAAVFGVVCTPGTNGSQPPLAVDDVGYVATAGMGVPLAVLGNDVVSTTGTLAIISVTTPTNGTATKNANGTITYVPSSLAPDTFKYTIIDTSQENSPSSEATVVVVPRTGFAINVECHGGDCLFDAVPDSLEGIASFTWNYGDNTPTFKAWTRAFHQYQHEGAFTVTARADYYSGDSSVGSVEVSIVFQTGLLFSATTDGLGVRVLVDYNSLLTFPGGPEAAQLHVSMGDARSDCLYLCGGGTSFSCYPYCQPIGDAYYRTGTYPVRVSVTDGTGATHHYAKYVDAVNSPPRPDFTFTRETPASFSYVFDPQLSWDDFDINSDPPFAPTPYEWDFGDGMTAVVNRPDAVTHLYPGPGQYTVGLRLSDAGGEVGFSTKTVDVVNAPPVAHIAVNCRVLDCTFSGAGTVDDGNDITTYEWTFGDGSTATGVSATKHYAAAGCYIVTLKVKDGAGLEGPASKTVPVGPPVFATAGGAVVDAHVQSFTLNGKPATSNGNLNGILEPGETVVVEPNWQAAASTQPVSVLANGLASTDYVYANPTFRDYASSYDLSTGTSDCWTSGRCYVLNVQTAATGRGANPHNDITFNETYTNGSPTPGSPIRIHVGGSFTDVLSTHWAYPYVESVLHAGVAGACNALTYCPNTPVTRALVAKWLVLAKHGASFAPPECTTPPFNDVPCSNPNAKWIAQLKADGVTNGTGDGNYAPDVSVTRAEMAVLVLRTKMGPTYAPPSCQWDYGDAPCPQHWASSWISELKRRDISNGCSANEYCPDDAIDRAQAASFVARAFGFNLATKACATSGPAYDTVQGHVPRPPLASLTFNPSPVFVGTTSTGTLTLGLATQNGVTVPLSIDNPSAASVPASVFVPPGQFSATFTVTPANVAVRTQTNISATYLGQTMTTRLDVCTPAPVITAQPTSRIIYNGESTTLSVTASGGGALTYQWYQGTSPSTATPIGTNSNTLTVAPTATTSYWVSVTNACLGTFSTTATVTVCNYPVITAPPLSDVIVTGATTTLSVTATGSGPFGYQWFEGASGTITTPVGTNSSTFTTPALTAPKSYWVRVTSTCNGTANVNSPTATITPVTSVTRRQLASSGVNSLTSNTTNWTRPTQAGSLLVAVVSSSHGAVVGAITPPTGWQLAVGYEWNNIKSGIYYYPNNPGGRAAETFTTVSFRDTTLQLLEYVGATTAPLDRTAFDGDHTPVAGVVSTGTTPATTHQKQVIVSALTQNITTTFTGANNSFVKVDERAAGYELTTAVHERIVATTGTYGHTATVTGTQQWLGLVATFKSIDACTVTPSITAQPVSSTINAGGSVTLSVTATGGSLTYQWFQGAAPSTSNPVIGATGTTLTVTPAATTSYWVRVSNACGTANSSTATVNVCSPVGIATQPLSQSVTSGFPATLSVVASGSGPFSYQWYEGASGTTTTPAGTNSSSFTTPALTATKSYWVKVTSTCNGTTTVNSNAATLTVNFADGIARRQFVANMAQSMTSVTAAWPQPTQAGSLLVAVMSAEHSLAVGTFTAPAGWQLANSYEMNNIKTSIFYYPNNPGGRTAETFTTASFRDQIIQLIEYTGATSTPLDKVVFNGDNTPASGVVSTGNTAVTSQAKELVLTALTSQGATTFTAPSNSFAKVDERNAFNSISTAVHERIVTTAAAYGHTASVTATGQWVGLVATFRSLDTCSTAPVITAQPASSTINSGQTATLSVTATGGGLSYQWYEGVSGTTTTPVGTNGSTFTTPALTATKSYWVRVTSTCGTASSTTATVIVCVPASITTQPASQVIASGGTATLTVTAGGTGPFSYQWYEGASGTTTTPVGTNSASFTTAALTAAKSYWVRVTGACGTASSNTATVSICSAPSIATQPASQTITSGGTATLSVVAGGSGPFTYQWYEGASGTTTTPVGTNSASFTTPALTATKTYWVRVTSTCNGSVSVNSNAATVTVNAVAVIARRQLASNTAQSMTSVTTTWPQATQAGSLLVAVMSAEHSALVGNFAAPAGWQLAATYEWNNIKTSIYYYPNNPGGRTSETFATASFRDQILQLQEYTGILAVSPLDRTAFNGDNGVTGGEISTGNTTTTVQPKELVISALTIHAQASYSAPTNSFVKIHDHVIGNQLTTAVFERIVTAAGTYGHSAAVSGNDQWTGLVVTFKSANTQ
jgi:hypothetical protein